MHIFISLETSVLDPDLEISGGEGGGWGWGGWGWGCGQQSSRLLGKGVQSPEKSFQFGLRIGGEQVPRAPPVDLDPLLNLPV